ncbi:MAG: HIT family protein [Cytophagales bacterium]|nr:HIT family protein [Cytophagales bacterium]
MASIFTKIINKEIPGHIVAEDDKNIAFLDINPLVVGHTLCVPKKEIDYIYDLNDEDFIALQLFAKKVAGAIRKAIPCKRIGEAVIGLEVPHTHVHLIPISEMDDMNFSRPKLRPTQAELADAAKKISECL